MQFNEDTLDKLSSARLKAEIADYVAKNAQADKKVQDALAKAYSAKIKDEEDLAQAHPVLDAINSGLKAGGTVFSTLFILNVLLGFITGRAGAGFAGAMVSQVAKLAGKNAIIVAGIKLPINYIVSYFKRKGEKTMQNESLGKTLLEKLDRLSGKVVNEEDSKPAEDTAPEETDPPEEFSETLKKLQGHLKRFQEAKGDGKAAAAGAVGGAVIGSKLAKRSANKAYGLQGASKIYQKQAGNAAKNAANFTNKAISRDALSKAAKAYGDTEGAKGFAKAAQAAAAKAGAAAKSGKGAAKAVKALAKPIKAAGRAGGWKGAAIGATAGLVGKKLYDKYKK